MRTFHQILELTHTVLDIIRQIRIYIIVIFYLTEIRDLLKK